MLRHADGSLRANELVVLNVEMIQNLIPVYSETQTVNTNDFGVFSIVVGQGVGEETYSSAIFLSSDSTHIPDTYLRVSESGGNMLSETKILGVPIAEVAKVALNVRMSFPVGAIFPFAGGTDKIPEGWLLCDGELYEVGSFPELFGVIGDSWGTTSPDLFRVPDLRGVFLRGASGIAEDEFADPDTGTRISRHDTTLTIIHEDASAVFRYDPIPDDFSPFSIVFTAISGEEIVSQSVRFTPVPDLQPDQDIIRYLHSEISLDTILMNRTWKTGLLMD